MIDGFVDILINYYYIVYYNCMQGIFNLTYASVIITQLNSYNTAHN